jgi:hypothetical protein
LGLKIEPAPPIGYAEAGRHQIGGHGQRNGGMEMMRVSLAMGFILMPVLKDAGSAKQMVRPDYIEYVCGVRGGQAKTYLNIYLARGDGAIQIRPGRCEDQQYSR